MSSKEHHSQIIEELAEEFSEIFDSSDQGVYVYLDDDHIACNGKLAAMLGYASPAEMMKVKAPFLESFVDEGSQHELVSAYRAAMEKKVGTHLKVTWKKHGGGTQKSDVMLVPISYQGHMMALHFIS